MAYIGNSAAEQAVQLEREIRQQVKHVLEPALHERVDQLYDALRQYDWLDKGLGRVSVLMAALAGETALLFWGVMLKHEDQLAALIPSLSQDVAVFTCLVGGVIVFTLVAAVGVAIAKRTPRWQRARARALTDFRELALHKDNRSIRVAIEARDPETADEIAKALRIE